LPTYLSLTAASGAALYNEDRSEKVLFFAERNQLTATQDRNDPTAVFYQFARKRE